MNLTLKKHVKCSTYFTCPYVYSNRIEPSDPRNVFCLALLFPSSSWIWAKSVYCPAFTARAEFY